MNNPFLSGYGPPTTPDVKISYEEMRFLPLVTEAIDILQEKGIFVSLLNIALWIYENRIDSLEGWDGPIHSLLHSLQDFLLDLMMKMVHGGMIQFDENGNGWERK